MSISITKKIWSILSSSERRTASLLLGLMLIGMVLETLGIGLVIPTIALFTSGDISSNYPVLKPVLQAMGNPTNESLVKWGLLLLLSVYIIKNLFIAFLIWRQTRFAHVVGAKLSEKLFSVYLRQAYTFHLQHNSALLLRNVYNEVGVFMGAISAFMVMVTELLVLLAISVMLFIIEPVSSFFVILVISLFTGSFYHFTRKQIKRWGESRQYHEGLRIQHLQQGLGGVKDTILLGREDNFISEYAYHNSISAHIEQMITTLQQMPRLWLEVIAIAGLVIMVLVMQGQGQAADSILPIIGFFAVAAFRLMPSANRILGALQTVRYDLPVINTLYKELHLPLSNQDAEKLPNLTFHNSLHFSNVNFSYENSAEPVIRNISLTITRGESVGFIGASGAGKSTLVDILLALLKPTTGTVCIDGKNINTNLRGWQNKIGYVSQSIYLTDDTLKRNIAFGLNNENIDDKAITRAIRAAQLEEFVSELPDGLDTQVGERGVRLSGGQRQRIGIARALYHDPEVLVLDEATSSLDISTEVDVMKAVNALHGTKTIIIIAHRLSTVQSCDRIYKLDKGIIIEEGTPEQIILTN